tara:strand:- start:372 stop:1472 length:1101 start_codon:yes stop_codon:yes gene_type:complete
MNELESYYNQSSNMGQTLGMIQRGEVAQRVGALNVQEAKDDIAEAQKTEKEKTEEEGGGVGMGAGLLSKEGVAVVGKKVIASATEKARSFIQSKVDVLSEAKAGTGLADIEGTGENLARTALANAGAGAGADAGGVADAGLRGIAQVAQPVDAGGSASINIGSSARPTGATATDEDPFGGNPNAGNLDAEDALNTNINAGAEEGGVLRRAFNVVKSKLTGGGNTQAEGAVSGELENAGAISSKTMGDLSDKIGVDFGDLSKSDIGEALGNAVGKTGLDAEKITSGLGIAGDAMEFLGPIGLIAGLGASIAGIFEAKKVNNDLIKKANDINSMTDNINGLGGMSFGSISNSAIDTSQFRSGGASLNF